MKEMLKLNKLVIGYASSKKDAKALMPPISVSMNSGDLVALTGPNGAGKTTLFRALSSNILPLGGEIFIDQQNMRKLHAREKSALLSIVLTDRIGDQYMKVSDVVASGRYPYVGIWARLNKLDRQIIDQSLHLAGIEALAARTLQSLSDGERQKVMIAKALAQDTPLILMDEPAAFLDYPSKIALIRLLKTLSSEHNKTILFSSHDLDMIISNVDKIWLMAPQKPMISGIPEDLLASGKMNDYFGIPYQLAHTVFDYAGLSSPKNNSVCVHGVGEDYNWLRHALRRKGYAVSETKGDIVLRIADGKYILSDKQVISKFDTLEKLTNEIDKYF
ncbi:MAG: ABC transporter ATP-binding protein [Bacteroidetes bacterium]|nr:ABC transporter ATP-binding protein [Bacteroidota bacterium]